MIESLLGGLVGGLFRLAPEVIKLTDKKADRAHELAMQDKALEFEKLLGAHKMAEIHAMESAATSGGYIDALQAGITAQGHKSGVRWVDALSSSVRPVITYWFMSLYCAAKCATFYAGLDAGVGWGTAVLAAWSEADMALWSGVLNFWFVGRVFERKSN